MKIPLSWLKEYIPVDLTPVQISKILTSAGLEVDAIDKMGQGFEKVVVAKVMEVQKHPEADKLCLATVSDGQEVYHVVCGASNCRPGIKTALALIGASLTDKEGKKFKIKKSKIRGVESFGMLCSFDDLGLSSDHEGIIEFADYVKEGTEVADLYADTVFDISLTPNLGHCSSLIGVARELSAATGLPIKYPVSILKETSDSILNNAIVEVLNPEACPRYVCRLVKGVTVGPSPDWLKRRLEMCGIRSINNVVDITNYVLLEMGHPLHAFDFNKLEGKGVVVRNAQQGEQFVTLDDKVRELSEGDLLICDREKPIALAGVMGGLNSEVSDTTTDVLIESAYFHPSVIRRTSKRLGLITDASKRFERGSDPNNLIQTVNRAAMLIQHVAGGELCMGVIDAAAKTFVEKLIKCRLTRINKILGSQLSAGEVESIFNRLGMSYSWDGQDVFSVKAPTYRNDLHEEIDLIEDVARIYGYDNIKKSTTRYSSSPLPHVPIFVFERQARHRLVGEGLQEFLTCDLIGPTLLSKVHEAEMPKDSLVKVLNPTSIEQSILRTSLLPGLLQVVKYNWDHQNQNIAGFEIGRIHFKDEDQYKEQSVVGIVLSGDRQPNHWDAKAKESDFFDLKGIIENFLSELKVVKVAFKDGGGASFHPGRSAAIYSDSLKVGAFGEIHPEILRRIDIPQRILFAEINLHDLYLMRDLQSKLKDLPLYPGSDRDLTVTLDEDLPIEQVFEAIQSVASPLLESTALLDIYRSDKLGKDVKNATFRFVYRDLKKTISQETVDAEHAQISKKVMSLGKSSFSM